MRGKLAIVTGALALMLPGVAHGATFCVNAPGCTGTAHPTLQAALADADTAAGPDRVELGPGTYDGPFAADADNVVEVVGAGRGSSVLTAPGDGVKVLVLAATGSSVQGLTVRFGGGNAMVGLEAPRAEDVAIDGTASNATGILAPATLTAEDVTIALPGGAGSTGVQVGPGLPTSSATLRHLTISGTGEGRGLVVSGGPPVATAELHDSVIRAVAQHIVTDCGALPPPCVPSTATVTTSYSAYDPAKVMSANPGDVSVVSNTPAPIDADPRLRDDLRPRYDSPLVDAADPAGGGASDASGAARVVDGNGDGTARSDIGALEYQRRAPVITAATATPGSAAVGVPIAFRAAAADADDEAVSAVWAFSDGATATGFEVTHAFGAPGAAAAELTVTDAAGATAKTSVATTIDAAPAPAPKPPRATARVLPDAVKLRAAARRDRRPPYRFKLRGRVVLPAGVSAAGCVGGRVTLAVRAGKRRMTRSARLAADCSFRLTLKLGRKRARRVVVTPRFTGTAALAPRDGAALRLRAG